MHYAFQMRATVGLNYYFAPWCGKQLPHFSVTADKSGIVLLFSRHVTMRQRKTDISISPETFTPHVFEAQISLPDLQRDTIHARIKKNCKQFIQCWANAYMNINILTWQQMGREMTEKCLGVAETGGKRQGRYVHCPGGWNVLHPRRPTELQLN